jgi:hypothetical protein
MFRAERVLQGEFPMRLFIALLAAACLGGGAAAQEAVTAPTMRYEAIIGLDGQVELKPLSGDAVTTPAPYVAGEPGQATADARSKLYLVKGQSGSVKAAFGQQPELLGVPLDPGDTVEVLAAEPGALAMMAGLNPPPPDQGFLEGIAKEAATKLISAAKDTACSMDPQPDTISPSVEISFSAGVGGGSLSVSATWSTSKLCPAP